MRNETQAVKTLRRKKPLTPYRNAASPLRRRLVYAVVLSTALLQSAHADSESARSPAVPKVCVAFNGEDHPVPWGEPGEAYCPKNYAVYSALRVGRNDFGKRVKRVTCCPLPHDDILLDEHVSSMKECPENAVVTGDTLVPPAGCPDCDLQTRCTMINTERYQLSDASPGAHWGMGASSWKESRRILKRDVPVAIRHALGRKSEFSWHVLGCVGYPFGALLSSTDAVECHHFQFRQLQYRGLPGDPPSGTPVQMFPTCRYISDRYDSDPECIE